MSAGLRARVARLSLHAIPVALSMLGCGATSTVVVAIPATSPTPSQTAPFLPDAMTRVNALATQELARLACPPPELEDEPAWERLGRATPCEEFPYTEVVRSELSVLDEESGEQGTVALAVLEVVLVQHGGCGNDVDVCFETRNTWLVGRGFEVMLETERGDEVSPADVRNYDVALGTVVVVATGHDWRGRDHRERAFFVTPDRMAVREASTCNEHCWVETPEGEVFDGGAWAWPSAERFAQVTALREALVRANPAVQSPAPQEELLSHAPPRQARLAARALVWAHLSERESRRPSRAEFDEAWRHVRFLAVSPDAARFAVWLRELGYVGAVEGDSLESLVEEEALQLSVQVVTTDEDANGRPEWRVTQSWFDEDSGDQSQCRVHAEDLTTHACEGSEEDDEALAHVIAGVHATRCEDDPQCLAVYRALTARSLSEEAAAALLAPFLLGP